MVIEMTTPKGRTIRLQTEDRPNDGCQIYMTDTQGNVIANEYLDRKKSDKVDNFLAAIEVFTKELATIVENSRG